MRGQLKRITVTPTGGQTRSYEIITSDGSPGPTCGLGKFQLVELPFKG